MYSYCWFFYILFSLVTVNFIYSWIWKTFTNPLTILWRRYHVRKIPCPQRVYHCQEKTCIFLTRQWGIMMYRGDEWHEQDHWDSVMERCLQPGALQEESGPHTLKVAQVQKVERMVWAVLGVLSIFTGCRVDKLVREVCMETACLPKEV